MKVVRKIVGGMLFLGQLVTIVIAGGLHWIARNIFMRTSVFIRTWIYYRTFTLLRRKVEGEPMWKDFDASIVTPPPKELARMEAEAKTQYDALPKCEACGAPKMPFTVMPAGEISSPPPQ